MTANISKPKQSSDCGEWDRLIVEAKAVLRELQIRKARLKASIKYFEDCKAKGIRFRDVVK